MGALIIPLIESQGSSALPNPQATNGTRVGLFQTGPTEKQFIIDKLDSELKLIRDTIRRDSLSYKFSSALQAERIAMDAAWYMNLFRKYQNNWTWSGEKRRWFYNTARGTGKPAHDAVLQQWFAANSDFLSIPNLGFAAIIGRYNVGPYFFSEGTSYPMPEYESKCAFIAQGISSTPELSNWLLGRAIGGAVSEADLIKRDPIIPGTSWKQLIPPRWYFDILESADNSSEKEANRTRDARIDAYHRFYGKQKFPCTSPFGARKINWHRGLDFGIKTPQPLYAPFDTTVMGVSNEPNGYGKFVKIAAPDGGVITLAHLSSQSVSQGQNVKAGTLLGYSGNTGMSTGPHLHIDWRPSAQTKKELASNPATKIDFYKTRNRNTKERSKMWNEEHLPVEFIVRMEDVFTPVTQPV